MKYLTIGLLIFVVMIFNACEKNNPEKLFKESLKKCKSINYGQYEMHYYKKWLSGVDTIKYKNSCVFLKDKQDTIYSFYFHNKMFSNSEKHKLYTGNELIRYSKSDSVGSIIAFDKLRQRESYESSFFLPILSSDNFPLPSDSSFIGKRATFEFVGFEKINNQNCYHLKMIFNPDSVSSDMVTVLKAENNYWIKEKDFIPIQYIIDHDVVVNGDSMSQYEKVVLINYDFDNKIYRDYFSLSLVPDYIKLKNPQNEKDSIQLELGEMAPIWSLKSLNNKKINLLDFRGELVLLDFFYKACSPCNLALPGLNKLYEKYSHNGLNTIGINPTDTIKSELAEFVRRKNLNYPIVIDKEKQITKLYSITAYPTVFLINQKGDIIYKEIGYSKVLEEKLDSIIQINI